MSRTLRLILLFGAMCLGGSFAQQNPAPFTVQTAKQSAADVPAATATSSISPAPTVPPVYHDALGRIVVETNSYVTFGLRYDGTAPKFSEAVDEFGNRTWVTADSAGLPLELKHEFLGRPVWNERMAYDASGRLLFTDVDSGESGLPAKASQFGIQVGFPDWVRINFAQSSTINQVDVITRQDNAWNTPVGRPLRESEPGGPTVFSVAGPGAGAGITDYEVQSLDANGKWIMIPGTYVTNNRHVARSFRFAPIMTSAIRLVIKGGIQGFSRVVEIEAFEKDTQRNVALASQGGSATASSIQTGGGHTPAALINGDETGRQWGAGGGWRDDTPDAPPAAGTVTVTSEYGNYTRTNFSNQFASVSRLTNNNPPPPTPPKVGMQFVMERADVTYSGGKSFSATAAIAKWGIEYWDNAGGSRVQFYDANKRLFYVTDWTDGHGTQPVVRINRDAQGRPTDVYLGNGIGLLQFVYGEAGWAYTRLINLTTNTTRFSIARRGAPPAPLGYPELLHLTHGYMPQYGPIAEWHDAISPVPNVVLSLRGMPYALLPTTQTGFVKPARWVITPFAADEEPMTNIRVEYDASNIYLHVPTLNAGCLTMGRDMIAFQFSRHAGSQAAADLLPRPEAEKATPIKPYDGNLFVLLQKAGRSSTQSQTFPLSHSFTRPSAGSGIGAGGSGGGTDGIGVENDNFPIGDIWYLQTMGVSANPWQTPGWVAYAGWPGDRAPVLPPEAPIGPNTATPNQDGFPRVDDDPNSTIAKQLDWALKIAEAAMKTKKCNAFLHDPKGLLKSAGKYEGPHGTIPPFNDLQFDTLWKGLTFYNGQSAPDEHCPDNPQNLEEGDNLWMYSLFPTHLYVCPALWAREAKGHDGTASQLGGAGLVEAVIHEFLHTLGLGEDTDGSGIDPTSWQITDAVRAGCGDAIKAAQGTSLPPI